jgi:hypothetical protein
MRDFGTQTSPRSKNGAATKPKKDAATKPKKDNPSAKPKKAIAKPEKAPRKTLKFIQAICIDLGLARPETRIWRSKKLLWEYIDLNYFPDPTSPSWNQSVGGEASLDTPGSEGSPTFNPDSPTWVTPVEGGKTPKTPGSRGSKGSKIDRLSEGDLSPFLELVSPLASGSPLVFSFGNYASGGQ